MKNILVIGAGLSASSMLRYFTQNAEKEDWYIKVVDQNADLAKAKVAGCDRAEGFSIDALNPAERQPLIEWAHLVISMLPARFHTEVAEDCIKYKTNLITPSYISKEMVALNEAAEEAGILIMNEIGVDPGIDHMSAKKILDEIEEKGGKMHIFESFTGGLIAPESDDNPWNYKFTWNPRNVVLAGQGSAAKFIQEGQYKYIPYNKLFRRTEIINIEGYGEFEGYANRDSLKYRSKYGLDDIPTIYRGTFRRKGFSKAWDCFVQLGATDDTYILEGSKDMTKRDFINAFLPYNLHDSVELKLRYYLKIDMDDIVWDKLVWLGIFEKEKMGFTEDVTPAYFLQKILEEKWALGSDDKDMIVMWHKFVYKMDGEFKEINSHMVSIGEDRTYTAMSNTVGLPCAICAKMILNGTIQMKGVQLPIHKEIYDPILDELETYDIKFTEKEINPPVMYLEPARL
ncbi:saccharopine dehydrogenase NADP-binding domain-containing protein [Paracrocinitomix mangrovi]|uniref:saccharopine dehydrogenase family protein n=1 Tax=Paracrocinitomix mangrovi TaxID=2862509 RepID=UPI001C8EB5CD|nr:saccharopine dehydrogenase C-terminal domain-containing protein [Paracrocinitomix mangrovi]UKN00612.1 saccharopine dehydrogenase NADP-binding domain-containing protein [Paracrocinitomix mangrovi]